MYPLFLTQDYRQIIYKAPNAYIRFDGSTTHTMMIFFSSILIKRSSDSIRNSRGSKVLSWSDISTTTPVQENVDSKKRTKSETELKTLPRGSGG